MTRFRRTTPVQSLVSVTVDGRAMELPEGETLAAALLVGGIGRFSDSVRVGEPRGPLCLMGSCFQCVAEIDGTPVTAEVYEEMCRSYDTGVAEFLDLSFVKPNILGNTRMLLTL